MNEMNYRPDWAPLEAAITPEKCHDYMYMGHSGDIAQYKHRDTRRYLNIDGKTGKFYRYTGQGYIEINKQDALASVLS